MRAVTAIFAQCSVSHCCRRWRVKERSSKQMRIAQVAPLYESVPIVLYGGTERVVSFLTEELVRMGHEVTLFASGDSVTNARLVAPCRRALRKNEKCKDPVAREVLLV